MISLICGIRRGDTNELIDKRERLTDFKNKLLVTEGKMWGEGIRSLILTYTHYYIYEIDNQQGCTV